VDLHITVGNSVTFRTPGSVMNLGGQGGVAQFGPNSPRTPRDTRAAAGAPPSRCG
jgi:hypothetical protein